LFLRHAERMAAEALADTRVVVVNGARQVGKSTLAELIVARSPGAHELYLDDQAVRAAAEADPSAFVRHDGLLMIDEIQRVPELLLAIKREVDRDTRPGRFLLTGSAQLLGLRDLPDALPGRTETIELWPLSQGEIDSAADGFVDAVFRLDGNVRTSLPIRMVYTSTVGPRADPTPRPGSGPPSAHRTGAARPLGACAASRPDRRPPGWRCATSRRGTHPVPPSR